MRDLLSSLFPPGVPALARWRLVIAGAGCIAIVHAAVAFGVVGEGFAFRGDVTDIKTELLEQRMFSVRVLHCDALKMTQAPAVKFHAEKLQDLRRKYRDIAATDYALPDCSEL